MKFIFLIALFVPFLFQMGCTPLGVNQKTTKVNRPPPPPRPKLPAAAPDVHYQQGVKFYQAKEYSKALDYFISAETRLSGQPKYYDAVWGAFRSAVRASRWYDVEVMSEKLLKRGGWAVPLLGEIYSGRIKSLDQLNDPAEALANIQVVLGTKGLEKDFDGYRVVANEIIESKLKKPELEKVASDATDTQIRGKSYFKLAELSLEQKDLDDARRYFGRCINEVPNTELASKALDLLSQLDSVRKVEPQTIGVVLPMSGKFAPVAQKTLRGIEMGLGLHNFTYSPFKLAVVNSEGNPDGARRGVERLIKEDNAIAIIGSVLSKTAPAVASKASELNVPSIALSQRSGITDMGTNVFRNSLTSEMQVRHLVKAAIEEHGIKKFAILFPNDQYGVDFSNLFWDEVNARGGVVTGAQSYSPKETDFRNVIQRLVGTYYLEDRAEEYKFRLKEWTDSQTKKSVRNNPPEDLLPPVVDFDAIFIPDSAKALGQIAAMLHYNNVKNVKLMGTNLWNTSGLVKRAGSSGKDLLFVDSFISADTQFNSSQFIKEYRQLFNEEPGIFEIQGYDSAVILRQLISQGANSRESLSQSLSQLKNFPGAIGNLSMTTEREILRPLVTLGIENGEIVPLTKQKAP